MLYSVLIDPFVQMVELPDLLVQVLWEGMVAGVLYSLIALGFVLIFNASACSTSPRASWWSSRR